MLFQLKHNLITIQYTVICSKLKQIGRVQLVTKWFRGLSTLLLTIATDVFYNVQVSTNLFIVSSYLCTRLVLINNTLSSLKPHTAETIETKEVQTCTVFKQQQTNTILKMYVFIDADTLCPVKCFLKPF